MQTSARIVNPRLRILVIDDDQEDYDLVRRHLEDIVSVDYASIHAESVEDACEIAKGAAFDAVIADFRLGAETLIESYDRLPFSIKDLPMIILTNFGSDEIALEFMNRGIDFFIDKDDLCPRLLDRLIRYALRNRDLQNRLSNFARMVAHDLKGPVNNISHFLGLISAGGGLGSGRDWSFPIDAATSECVKVSRLIDDLLSYARSSSSPLNLLSVDLTEVALRAVDNLKAEIWKSGAIVKVSALPKVHADPDLMLHVFQNLISNGLKYQESGSIPEVLVESVGNPESIEVSVRDNGIGIERECLEKIFQALIRLHADSKYSGTGLGLSICREIVERHGWRIFAESEPGQGSVFKIRLPGRSVHS